MKGHKYQVEEWCAETESWETVLTTNNYETARDSYEERDEPARRLLIEVVRSGE